MVEGMVEGIRHVDRKWETHRDRPSDVIDLGYIPVQRSRENATTNDNEIIT